MFMGFLIPKFDSFLHPFFLIQKSKILKFAEEHYSYNQNGYR